MAGLCVQSRGKMSRMKKSEPRWLGESDAGRARSAPGPFDRRQRDQMTDQEYDGERNKTFKNWVVVHHDCPHEL